MFYNAIVIINFINIRHNILTYQEIWEGKYMSDEVFMNIRIAKDLRTRLNIVAKRDDTTVKAIITDLVIQYLEEHE